MKFKLHYNQQEKRLYINKNTVIAFILLLILLIGFVVVIFVMQSKSLKLTTPEQDATPLGFLPDTVQNVSKTDTADINAKVLERLQKDYGNKLTIVFFYDGYQDQKEPLARIEAMKRALLSVEPFKSLSDLIAFKVFTTEGKPCSVQAQNGKKNLVCDTRLAQGLTHLGIDHIKIVVLSPEEFDSGSTLARGSDSLITISTYQGKLKEEDLVRWIGIVFTQEMGHSLGLRYEYSKAKPSQFQEDDTVGLPNCVQDKATAEKTWKNYLTDFPEITFPSGCGGQDQYIYPEKNTLMSDLPQKEKYGQVSEDYLRGILSCFYGNKEAIIFSGGYSAGYSENLKNCTEFKKQFPKFWEE